jgi:hypothetical protein
MRTFNQVAEDYIALWNERSELHRTALIQSSWTTDAVYVDPIAKATGLADISALIGAIQAKFPESRFTLNGLADGFGDYVRFSWACGPEGSPATFRGTDIVRRQGDGISSVVGFLDQAPEGK